MCLPVYMLCTVVHSVPLLRCLWWCRYVPKPWPHQHKPSSFTNPRLFVSSCAFSRNEITASRVSAALIGVQGT
ncbi:hypothetical protein COO60DRAFT_222938 [Scenedesmus sp. NREL 46B-D3]|nr:hypothetical protein COO60DRAFT_222938 [Scenedesmus sp. NREL 46B-D3]